MTRSRVIDAPPCRDCRHFDCLMDRGEPLPDGATGYWNHEDYLAERPYQPTPEGIQRVAERVARRRGAASDAAPTVTSSEEDVCPLGDR